MINVQELLAKEGATFINAFTSSPICCPSRASLLSGRYAHNHATINNSVSGGCYGSFWKEVIEKTTLPVMLQKRGYETFFAGKYLNDYKSTEVPPGWTHWYSIYSLSFFLQFKKHRIKVEVSGCSSSSWPPCFVMLTPRWHLWWKFEDKFLLSDNYFSKYPKYRNNSYKL